MNDQRTILGIVLCVLFYLGYTKYLQTKYPDYGKASLTSPTEESASLPADDKSSSEIVASSEPADSQPIPSQGGEQTQQTNPTRPTVIQLGAKQTIFENNVLTLAWAQNKPALVEIDLKNYQANLGSKEKAADKVNLAQKELMFSVYFDKDQNASFPISELKREDDKLVFSGADNGFTVQETFTLERGDFYAGRLNVKITNISDQPRPLVVGLAMNQDLREANPAPKSALSFLPGMPTQINHISLGIDGGHSQNLVTDACGEESAKQAVISEGPSTKVDFLGIDRHYFLSLLSPQGTGFSYKIRRIKSPGDSCQIEFIASQDQGIVKPGETVSLEAIAYFGPKSSDQLVAVSPNLKKALDLGFFDRIGQPLLAILKWLYGFVGNYGIAIILLTILLKMAFYPLTRAAAISMKNMQKLQPEMNRIKEKHKNDKALQQQEIMKFMSAHKINPAKGCLPVLPQIPVFIAFYSVLSQSIELRHAPFFGWIQDLSAADHFYVTPLLLGLGMVFQQKLTPNPSMDKAQQRIMMLMPAVFTIMMLSLPAGMVLYMLINTFVSIAQQQWLNHKLGKRPQSGGTAVIKT